MISFLWCSTVVIVVDKDGVPHVVEFLHGSVISCHKRK